MLEFSRVKLTLQCKDEENRSSILKSFPEMRLLEIRRNNKQELNFGSNSFKGVTYYLLVEQMKQI